MLSDLIPSSFKDLDLASTNNLSHLPEEIWNASSSTKLNLKYSAIKSLPSSIGKPQNLKVLYATRYGYRHTRFARLPNEILSLKNLDVFEIDYSAEESETRILNLGCSRSSLPKQLEEECLYGSLSILVKHLKISGHATNETVRCKGKMKDECKRNLGFALTFHACS